MNFKVTKESLNMPWTMSPFFLTLLRNDQDLTDFDRRQCMNFFLDGYIMVDLELSNSYIQDIVTDMLNLGQSNSTTQHKRFHYSDGPRLFKGAESSVSIASLTNNSKIKTLLRLFYGREPIPFQTINFLKGSNQPMHSDSIHFNTVPAGWLAGTWVALEDMDLDNGTLEICPGSHTSLEYDLSTLKLKIQDIDDEFNNYSVYEDFICELIRERKYTRRPVICKKGTAVIWANNLLHGGIAIKDPSRTRYSQATHYFFPGCEHYYCPLFSEPSKGIYAEKNLLDTRLTSYE